MAKNAKLFFVLLAVLLANMCLAQETVDSTIPEQDTTGSAPTTVKTSSKISAFGAAVSSIVVSELGDKTFFIAAIMAMRYNRLTVLAGASTALVFMTGIATAFGAVFTALISPSITKFIVTILFFFFGGKLLWDAYQEHKGAHGTEEKKSADPEELEVELETLHVKLLERSKKQAGVKAVDTNESGDIEAKSPSQKRKGSKGEVTIAESAIYWQALTLTFFGEWGDRSQITTVALASQSNAFAVFVGASLGHLFCTSLAVIGGKLVASKISEKTMNICGGLLFVAFGLHNVFWG